jgi:S1-C subfamily serine protease
MLPDETPQQLWDLVNPALVTEVIADGPADEAGVEVNDIIIALDGRALDDDYRLSEEIPQRNPGEEVLLTVVRRGENTEIFELEITLSTGEDEHGEMVTYLGLWYESISRRGLIVPHAEGALD